MNNYIIRAKKFRSDIQTLAPYIPAEKAMEMPYIFDAWSPTETYHNGDIRLDPNDGQLYRCIVPEGSVVAPNPTWLPSVSPSIWALISDPREEWPEFIQPTGAHNAYAKGDKVTFNGKRYVSLLDNNTWSPVAYSAGWEEIA